MTFNYTRYGSYKGSGEGFSSKAGVHGLQTGNLFGDGSDVTFKVFGAGGGPGNNYSNNGNPHHGGDGGYSEGTLLSVLSGTTFYIVVGQGGVSQTGNTQPARYNGGAKAGNGNFWGGSGGGASHVATATGILSSLSGNTSAVIIVAGGGGGGGNCSVGGDGGGTSGLSANATGTQFFNRVGGQPGTQSAGGNANYGGIVGAFGVGGYSNQNLAGGGGGGWYGGGGGNNSTGGGGGSGYVGFSASGGLPALTSTTMTTGGGSQGGQGSGGLSGNNQSNGTPGTNGKIEVYRNGSIDTTYNYTGGVQTFTV